jgi:succinylglutamate desuccinylase/N-acetylglutamate synthase-like GNAT family acetyltransferase
MHFFFRPPLLASLFFVGAERMSKSTIRRATNADLPSIRNLIKDSFAALNEYVPESMHERIREAADSLCQNELVDPMFENTYFAPYGNHFWVAEDFESKDVYGCVGLKRLSCDSAELVRMAVSPLSRGTGIGTKLVDRLLEYCGETGVLNVILVTGNPRSAQFYAKNRFITVSDPNNRAAKMVKYLGERLIRRVAIIGGTHGNERIGVELVRQWSASEGKAAVTRSTFETSVMLGNPAAVEKNTRFVDVDLNRQFLGKRVAAGTSAEADGQPTSSTLEQQRAVEIDKILGPKGALNEPHGCDFVIDVHSSNSNVGLMAMLSSAENDVHATRMAHYLQNLSSEGSSKDSRKFPGLRVTTSLGDKDESWSIDSVSPFGISFEVGPLTHGTLSSDLLEKTRDLVLASLDFIEEHNKRLLAAVGGDSGVVRSQWRDVILANSSPAADALITRKGPFPQLECFHSAAKVEYPTPSSKAADKDDQAAETTPGLYTAGTIVHPQLEGRDWDPLALTDSDGNAQPAFISTDGTRTVTPFSRPSLKYQGFGPPPPDYEKEPLYPVFINEAAYQRDGIAFALYKKMNLSVF